LQNELNSVRVAELKARLRELLGSDIQSDVLEVDSKPVCDELHIKDILQHIAKKPVAFRFDISDTDYRQLSLRVFLCDQIVNTEKSYVAHLTALLDFWEPELPRSQIVADSEMPIMIGNIPELKMAHSEVPKVLEELPRGFHTPMGEVFCWFVPYFMFTAPFISRDRSYDKAVHSVLHRNKEAEQELEEINRRCSATRTLPFFCVT
jgi:hypothetical protein